MKIKFTKISDEEHSLRIRRDDGSSEESVLNSRSFLRHDLAHLAVESEVPLLKGFWGSVADGASLAGMEIRGPDIMLAEALSGPVQTLMRVEAKTDKYLYLLERVIPEFASIDLASRIREKGRQLQGHWKATAYGSGMSLEWNGTLVNT